MAFRIALHIMSVLLLMAASVPCMSQAIKDITVIANDIGTKSLNEQEVMDAFQGKNNFWSNGQVVMICLPETKSSDASPVCAAIYNKSVSDVQKFWLSQVFQGRARAPQFIESDQAMIDFVKKNPGAIAAFMNENSILIPQDLLIQIGANSSKK